MIDQALEEGARGFTTGLTYQSAVFADSDEIVELAKALRPFGYAYHTHMRDYGANLLDAVRESIDIASVLRRAEGPSEGRVPLPLGGSSLRVVTQTQDEAMLVDMGMAIASIEVNNSIALSLELTEPLVNYQVGTGAEHVDSALSIGANAVLNKQILLSRVAIVPPLAAFAKTTVLFPDREPIANLSISHRIFFIVILVFEVIDFCYPLFFSPPFGNV
jgi:hypothetical protein